MTFILCVSPSAEQWIGWPLTAGLRSSQVPTPFRVKTLESCPDTCFVNRKNFSERPKTRPGFDPGGRPPKTETPLATSPCSRQVSLLEIYSRRDRADAYVWWRSYDHNYLVACGNAECMQRVVTQSETALLPKRAGDRGLHRTAAIFLVDPDIHSATKRREVELFLFHVKILKCSGSRDRLPQKDADCGRSRPIYAIGICSLP